jgi:hypothetical protein
MGEWEEAGSTFKTIEGNSGSNDVSRQHRNMGEVYRPSTGGLGFVRVLN